MHRARFLVRVTPHAGSERLECPATYTFVPLGSTQKRFDGMVAGQCVGGMVSAPFRSDGRAAVRFHILGSAIRKRWALRGDRDDGRAVRGLRRNRPRSWRSCKRIGAARAWLYAPANRAEAIAILARNGGITPEIAAQIAPAVLASPASYSGTGAFDVAGVQTVMDFCARPTRRPRKRSPPRKAFIDPSSLKPSLVPRTTGVRRQRAARRISHERDPRRLGAAVDPA